jgi:hypothetical protein
MVKTKVYYRILATKARSKLVGNEWHTTGNNRCICITGKELAARVQIENAVYKIVGWVETM